MNPLSNWKLWVIIGVAMIIIGIPLMYENYTPLMDVDEDAGTDEDHYVKAKLVSIIPSSGWGPHPAWLVGAVVVTDGEHNRTFFYGDDLDINSIQHGSMVWHIESRYVVINTSMDGLMFVLSVEDTGFIQDYLRGWI